jgi:hypothetical protein
MRSLKRYVGFLMLTLTIGCGGPLEDPGSPAVEVAASAAPQSAAPKESAPAATPATKEDKATEPDQSTMAPSSEQERRCYYTCWNCGGRLCCGLRCTW